MTGSWSWCRSVRNSIYGLGGSHYRTAPPADQPTGLGLDSMHSLCGLVTGFARTIAMSVARSGSIITTYATGDVKRPEQSDRRKEREREKRSGREYWLDWILEDLLAQFETAGDV